MFSLRHLTIFKAVSDTGSFTRAARELYITQSAVSHAIRELEEFTGLVLFERLSRKVCLTSGGKLLLDEVIPILFSCDALEKRMGNLEAHAPLQIVSSITIAAFWLPHILQEMQKQIPETPVSVKVVSAAEAVRILRSGSADIALIEGIPPQGPFLHRRFADYPLKIVCAPGYPLKAQTISIDDFCSEKLLLREPGSAIRDTLDSRLLLVGRTVHPLWVSVNSTALVEAAKAGLGLTVLPDVLLREAIACSALIPVEVEGLSLKNDLIAIWHREKYLSNSMKVFLSCIPCADITETEPECQGGP